jgi:hypothetical protein
MKNCFYVFRMSLMSGIVSASALSLLTNNYIGSICAGMAILVILLTIDTIVNQNK